MFGARVFESQCPSIVSDLISKRVLHCASSGSRWKVCNAACDLLFVCVRVHVPHGIACSTEEVSCGGRDSGCHVLSSRLPFRGCVGGCNVHHLQSDKLDQVVALFLMLWADPKPTTQSSQMETVTNEMQRLVEVLQNQPKRSARISLLAQWHCVSSATTTQTTQEARQRQERERERFPVSVAKCASSHGQV